MSPVMLRLLAGLLVVIAAVLAVVGWQISQRPAPAPAVQTPVSPQPLAPREVEERPASGHAVVVAARGLSLGQRLDPEAEPAALRVIDYPEPVPGSYAEPAALAGQRLTRPVAEGDILRPAHFAAGGAMAQAVPPGKRAIAVGVDEVIGGGGFLAPGDRVDVLYQAQTRSATDGSQAQLARRLFDNIQVISYGEALQGMPGAEGQEAPLRSNGRTAVLALDGEQAATLLLAETTGRLRLALIGAEEHRALLEQEAIAREGTRDSTYGSTRDSTYESTTATQPGILPPMAGLPQLAAPQAITAVPQTASSQTTSPQTTETSTTNGQASSNDPQSAVAVNPTPPGFGPVVVFDELTALDDDAAEAEDQRSTQRAAQAPAPRRVIQHIGGEARMVEVQR